MQELIPLGAPGRDCVAATPHPVSGSPRIEPSEKTPKLLNSLPKCIPPTKNPELEHKSTSAALKASNKRPEQDSIVNRKVVRKLRLNNGNINSRKNGSLNPTVKKDTLQRTSSYNRNKDLSYALSKKLNENLRVNATINYLIHFKVIIHISKSIVMQGFPNSFSAKLNYILWQIVCFILCSSKI